MNLVIILYLVAGACTVVLLKYSYRVYTKTYRLNQKRMYNYYHLR